MDEGGKAVVGVDQLRFLPEQFRCLPGMITCLIWLGDGDLIDLVCLDATSRLRKTILFYQELGC